MNALASEICSTLAAIEMVQSLKLYGLAAMVLVCSCAQQSSIRPINTDSDTTEILKVLLDTSINRKSLPDYERLSSYSPLNDTIIFETDSILNRNLIEATKGGKYKILSGSQICSVISTNFNIKNSSTHSIHFLRIEGFQKVGEGYYVELHNVMMTPPQVLGDLHPQNKECISGNAFNSGIRMGFTKTGNSFVGKALNRWEAFPTAANIMFMK